MENLSLAGIFAYSLWVALSGALMPGPVLMVTVAGVTARGFGAAPRVVLGHALLELAVVAAIFRGLARVLAESGSRHVVIGVIGLAGAAALLWMAWGMGSSAWRGNLRLDLQGDPAAAARGTGARDAVAGAVASVSNPYWILWWLTLGAASMVAAMKQGLGGAAAFYLGHISGDLVWYTAVGALVAAGRRSIDDRVYRGFLLLCAVALAVLAILFGAFGLGRLAAG
ncbi:MAG: LysE family transporter [Armatimonadetes bacterium]|nr:LysE family transporter [Armatimonadota bacterium]